MPRPRIASDVAIGCVDASLARGGRRVVEGVTFDLLRGRVLAIMGSTGSGKSTLLAAFSGVADVTLVGGTAHVDGIPIGKRGRAGRVRQYVTGVLGQEDGARLPARLTVSEVISEPVTSRDRRVNARALALRVASLLDELELPLGIASSYPYELSSGMRQRVALARALVLQPRVLVCDEPYANLDLEVRSAVRGALVRRREEEAMAILMASNDTDAIRGLDADVLVLRAGHPVGFGHGPSDVLWTPDEQTRLSA